MPPDWLTVPKAGPVPKDALRYFRRKGYRVSFSHRDVWKEEHKKAFTIAGAMRMSVIADLRSSLDAALEQGVAFDEWRKDIATKLGERGWWGEVKVYDIERDRQRTIKVDTHRLRTIYETNMRTSRSRGSWQRIQRTKDALPYLQYNLGPSQKHRPEHEAVAGTILSADDPFWSASYPPNGWRCKCWVRQLSAGQADREGGVSEEAPASAADPDWDYNPGAIVRDPR